MEFSYFIRVLLRKKWIIVLLTLLASGGAFTFIMFKKDLYESVAQYSTGFTSEKVKLSDGSVAVDIYTLDIKFNNVIETFNSPRVIGMLSYKLMLHDLENTKKPFKFLTEEEKRKSAFYKNIHTDTLKRVLKEKISGSELLSPSNKLEKDVLDYIKVYEYDYSNLTKMLIIRRVERTDYLDIIYQSENPELSAYVVNNLGSEFLNYYKDLNKVRNTESAQNIEQLLIQQQQKVDSLTNELKVARVSQGALDPVEQTKNVMETVKELQLELSTAQSQFNLDSRLYESYVERIKALSSQLNVGTGQDALILFKKRDDLREIISRSSNPDPDLIKQLNSLEVQIKMQSSSGANRTTIQSEVFDLQRKASESKARMTAAGTSISQLKRLIATSGSKSNVSPKTQVEIEAIDRQLEIENNELKGIREKLSLAEGLIKDDPTANFRQTLVGEPDIEPVPKRKILTTGLAGISTFVMASVFFLMIAIFDNAVKTPTQFNKQISLSLKTALNEINLKKHPLQEILFQELNNKNYKKENFFKNNIRKLRHEVEKTGKQVFLITSTENKVGKSLVTQALSYSLLLNKRKILIIDLNFENNTLTTAFNADQFIEELSPIQEDDSIEQVNAFLRSNVSGEDFIIEEVLNKQLKPGGLLDAVSSTSVENLFILGCRGGSYTPTEMATSHLLKDILKEARQKFDYVIIESAALNHRSDTYELFQYADYVLTVFSAKTSIGQPDFKSIEAIKDLKEKNFGVVLNRVDYENMNY